MKPHSRSPDCAPSLKRTIPKKAGIERNRACNLSHSMRFRRRLIRVPQVGRSRQSLARARRRAGRTPFDPQRARAGERPERANDQARTSFGRSDYLQATSTVAPNVSGSTVDLPSPLERAEEQMAFGYFSRAGARAERNRSHSSTMRSVTFRQRGETRGFKRKSSPQSNGPEEAERIRRQALHAVARSTLQ